MKTEILVSFKFTIEKFPTLLEIILEIISSFLSSKTIPFSADLVAILNLGLETVKTRFKALQTIIGIAERKDYYSQTSFIQFFSLKILDKVIPIDTRVLEILRTIFRNLDVLNEKFIEINLKFMEEFYTQTSLLEIFVESIERSEITE